MILVGVGGFYLFNYFISVDPVLEGRNIFYFTAAIIIFSAFWYLRARYFEYDSNGEVFIFINKGVLLTDFVNYREQKAEFPKAKLYNYKIKDYLIYRALYIYVRSKDDTIKRISFDITFISPKRVDLLKQSLNKVLKQNRNVA